VGSTPIGTASFYIYLMYKKVCKWCNEEVVVEKQPLFALHVANCKFNPSLERRNRESSLKFKGVEKVERIILKKECPKCGFKFEVRATKSEIRRNKVRNFCSRKCGNTRIVSDETKLKIRNTILSNGNLYTPDNKGRVIHRPKKEYLGREFTCLYCEKIGIDKCYNKNRKYHKECWLKISGGIKMGSSRSKHGWYNGYWCDSSYELAFVIYNLENGIDFERNHIGFEYEFEGVKRLFYPDFIINGVYFEIKNYRSDITNAKLKNFPHKISVLYKEDMIPYLEYAKSKYGKRFTELYQPHKTNPPNEHPSKI
jgi:hypothetical protein